MSNNEPLMLLRGREANPQKVLFVKIFPLFPRHSVSL